MSADQLGKVFTEFTQAEVTAKFGGMSHIGRNDATYFVCPSDRRENQGKS